MNALAARPPRPGGGAADTKQYRTHFRRGPFAIHQILAGATPGDAITTAALEYRDVLRRVGPSEVFAASHRSGCRGRGEAPQRVRCRRVVGSVGVPRVDRRAGGVGLPAFSHRADRARVPQHHALEVLRRARFEIRGAPHARPRRARTAPSARRDADRRLTLQRRRARGDRLPRRARDPARREPVPARAHASRRGNAQLSRPGVSTSRSSCSWGSSSRTSGPTCS